MEKEVLWQRGSEFFTHRQPDGSPWAVYFPAAGAKADPYHGLSLWMVDRFPQLDPHPFQQLCRSFGNSDHRGPLSDLNNLSTCSKVSIEEFIVS